MAGLAARGSMGPTEGECGRGSREVLRRDHDLRAQHRLGLVGDDAVDLVDHLAVLGAGLQGHENGALVHVDVSHRSLHGLDRLADLGDEAVVDDVQLEPVQPDDDDVIVGRHVPGVVEELELRPLVLDQIARAQISDLAAVLVIALVEPDPGYVPGGIDRDIDGAAVEPHRGDAFDALDLAGDLVDLPAETHLPDRDPDEAVARHACDVLTHYHSFLKGTPGLLPKMLSLYTFLQYLTIVKIIVVI